MTNTQLTARQRQVLECIEASMRDRGYPPSVREIGEAVGLTSPSTVHAHLATLQKMGYLRRDPTKPRAIEVRYDPLSGAAVERRPVRHVPLVGDVAAGTDVLAQENVEEVLPAARRLHRRRRPVHAAGPGRLDDRRRDLRRRLRRRAPQPTAENGEIVVAGIPGEEATVKTFQAKGDNIVLVPVQRAPLAHGVPRRRRHGVRPGRHRHASTLRRSAGCADRRIRSEPWVTSARTTRKHHSSGARSRRSSAVWASSAEPGPKLTAGISSAAKRATSVQPSFALTGRSARPTNAATSGSCKPGSAPARHVDDLERVAVLQRTVEHRSHERLGLGG